MDLTFAISILAFLVSITLLSSTIILSFCSLLFFSVLPPLTNCLIIPPKEALCLFPTVLIGGAGGAIELRSSPYLSGSLRAIASNILYGSNEAAAFILSLFDRSSCSTSTLAAYSGSEATFLESILLIPKALISFSTSAMLEPWFFLTCSIISGKALALFCNLPILLDIMSYTPGDNTVCSLPKSPDIIRSLTIVPLMPPDLSILDTAYPASLYFAVCSGVLSATKALLPLSGINTLRRAFLSEDISKA